MSPFRRAVLLIAIPLVAASAAYTGYWYYMAGRLRAGLAPWAEAERAQGYDVHWNRLEIGGFPTEFNLRFSQARLGTARPVPVALETPLLSVTAAPWNLHQWRFALPEGGHLGDGASLAGFTFGRLDGSTEPDKDGSFSFDVTATGLSGEGLAHDIGIAKALAHVEVPARPPASHLDSALDVALQLNNVSLPVQVSSLGSTVTGLSFSLRLKGGLPPGKLPQALAAWRDQGGTVELQYVRLHWGSLLVDASGTLALDQALQPEGALSAEITGQDAAVDLAVLSGALKPADAGIIKAVLDVLAKPGPNGEKAITTPLTVQESRVFLGPAAIAKVPHITWK